MYTQAGVQSSAIDMLFINTIFLSHLKQNKLSQQVYCDREEDQNFNPWLIPQDERPPTDGMLCHPVHNLMSENFSLWKLNF